jgi:hypothetical protein
VNRVNRQLDVKNANLDIMEHIVKRVVHQDAWMEFAMRRLEFAIKGVVEI